ncbi:MAG: TetR/AcrR family transcriptional regulator [Pseudomonadota bacterium]
MLDAAAIKFRENGISGVGVNAIALAADVTSGAIYSQFTSKDALFGAVVGEAMERLIAGLVRFRAEGNDDWFIGFVEYYLSAEHLANVGGGCGFPSLSLDVGRSEDATRAEYAKALERAVTVVTHDKDKRSSVLFLLSSLLGAVTILRATKDEALRQTLLNEVLALARSAGLTSSEPPTLPTSKSFGKK